VTDKALTGSPLRPGAQEPYSEAHGLVRNLLARLPYPDRLPAPTVLIEQDGDLGFDWDEGREATVSASLSTYGIVSWAALVGDWKAHGRFQLPGWSAEFDDALTKLGLAAAGSPPQPQIADLIPANWTDPLLTGPTAIIGQPPYDCRDIEQLLIAIRLRIEAAGSPPQKQMDEICQGVTGDRPALNPSALSSGKGLRPAHSSGDRGDEMPVKDRPLTSQRRREVTRMDGSKANREALATFEPPLLHETKALNPWQPESNALALALLGKLSEEVGELTAAVARCMIQGINESEPVTGKPNRDWLEDELADVSAAGSLVIEYFGLNDRRMDARFDRKREHLKAWHRLLKVAPLPPPPSPERANR
jgi:hypothetical protein